MMFHVAHRRAPLLMLLAWLCAPVTLLGCASLPSKAKTLDAADKGIAIAADVSARAAGSIQRWAAAEEMRIAKSAASMDEGTKAIAQFEAAMAPVDKAVAIAQLSLVAAASAVTAAQVSGSDADLIVMAMAVKQAYDAVKALQAAIAGVMR